MGDYNKVTLLGRLGADPEVRYTASGAAVANFTLATNERWRDKDGNKKERSDFHRCTAWGKTAEVIGEHLRKGSQVLVEGRLQNRDWEDKEGNKRQTTEVMTDRVVFVGGRQDSDGAGPSRPAGDGGRQDSRTEHQRIFDGQSAPVDDSDIPF